MKKIRLTMIGMIICGCIAMAIGLAFLFSKPASRRVEKGIEDYLSEGKIYLDDGEYMKAAVSFQRALELEENNAEALVGAVEAYEALHYYPEEEKARELLTQVEPDNIDNWAGIVMVKMNQDQLVEAKALMEELLTRYNDEGLKGLYHQMDIKEPEFQLEEGEYDTYQILKLKEIPDNATVYYTTDGTEPNEYSPVYGDEIILSYPENVVKAIAIGYLGYQSKVVEKKYRILARAEEIEFGSSEFDWRVRNILHKDWNSPIYNYEIAQFRSLYILGDNNVYLEEQPELTFYKDYYQWYQSSYSEYGNTDLDMLLYMPFLKTLVIGYQDSIDMSAISDFKYLENLSLLNDGIEDVQSLRGLKNLKKLALGWNQITDVSPLAEMTNLVSLGLWDNQIQNVECLERLEQLSYFDISCNQIQNIECIQKMPNLSELWIYGNQIRDFTPINSCHGLTVLMCADNPAGNFDMEGEIGRSLIKTDIETGGK